MLSRRYVLNKTDTIDETGGFNMKVVMALAVAWTLTCLVLVKGVKVMGKISMFTATVSSTKTRKQEDFPAR
jgi:hypothetical protein